jgi:tRNA(fMet)-specific endonuclease VapC
VVVKVLLDTNAYSALMRGLPSVVDKVRNAEKVLLSTIVIGELLYGFRYGGRFEKNLDILQRFLEDPYVDSLPATYVTADRFSLLAAALRRKGKPIPTNDIWIAAHTLEVGADLLSYNDHFSHIDGLPWHRLRD